MNKRFLNILAIIIVFNLTGLAEISKATPSEKPKYKPITTTKLQKPSRYKGLIKLNQHVYYPGDKLEISVVLPEQLKTLLEDNVAEAHLLVYFPPNTIKIFPVMGEGKFFEAMIETSTFAAGNYQLALVFTQLEGDAAKISDWYNGFMGLVSVSRIKIRDGFPGSEEEDIDGDGVIDDDIDSDGFSDFDDVVDVAATLPIEAAENGALGRSNKTNNTVEENIVDSKRVTEPSKQSAEGDNIAGSQIVESVPIPTNASDFKEGQVLKPSVTEAVDLLSKLKTPAEEYYFSMDKFIPTLELIGAKTSGQYVIHIKLNPKELYYQATLKNESEGVDSAVAGKTIRLTFDQTDEIWICSSGNPNGVDKKYLPAKCHH